MTLNLGKQSFLLTDIADKEKEITEMLLDAFHNVNNDTLTKSFNKPFVEYYINFKGEFTTSEWTNYQSYLLSSKYPAGGSRTSADTPLTTSVAAPNEALNSYKQKYATLDGIELPLQKIEPVAPKVVAEAPKAEEAGVKVDGYTLDGKTKNTYTLKNGDVDFAGTVDSKGDVTITVVNNDTTKALAKNDTIVDGTVIKFFIDNETFNSVEEARAELDTPEKIEGLVAEFIELTIAADLKGKLTQAPKVEVKEEETPTKPTVKEEPASEKYDAADTDGPSDNFRKVGPGSIERMNDAELQIFKEWHAANVPNIPYEALDRMITTYDGEKAWGVFENGVAKFVKGGLRATEYHEIFEGIYKGMLSPEEQQGLLDEFKSKKGEFIDRATKKKIVYADATDSQAKERIADDFADFRKGKLPARSLTERVGRFFKMIMDFFKSFVTKASMKEDLFKSIEAGKFKERTLRESAKNDFAEYRKVGNLTEQQTNEYVEDMTARSAGILFAEGQKQLLFKPRQITSSEMFAKIEERYIKEKKMEQLGTKAWEELKAKTIIKLRTKGVNFTPEGILDINTEGANKNDYAPEAFTTDWKNKSTGAVKFTVGTLLQAQATNQEGR
jgi:hypothetical protein